MNKIFKVFKVFKGLNLVMVISILALLLAACGNDSVSSQKSKSDNKSEGDEKGEYKITAAHGVAVNTTFDQAMHKFKELVEEKTNGSVEVSVHPAAELGAEPDLFQGLVEGTVDVMITAPGSLGDFVPELSLFDLAFLIKNADHQREITEGEVGEELAEIMEERTGVITIGYGGGAGRNMYFTESAETLEDIQGREFRALPTSHPFFDALGLNTTYLPHPEIYTGLQQGVIEGGENEPFFTISEGFSEVAPNYLLTQHDVTVRPILISPHTLERLPEEIQSIVLEAGQEAAEYEFELELAAENDAIEQMESDGVNVVELENKEKWIEKVEPVWFEWAEEQGVVDLLEKMIELGEGH